MVESTSEDNPMLHLCRPSLALSLALSLPLACSCASPVCHLLYYMIHIGIYDKVSSSSLMGVLFCPVPARRCLPDPSLLSTRNAVEHVYAKGVCRASLRTLPANPAGRRARHAGVPNPRHARHTLPVPARQQPANRSLEARAGDRCAGRSQRPRRRISHKVGAFGILGSSR